MNALIRLSGPLTRQSWEIPVLFEDEHLLALDKPSDLLTSPDRYDPERPSLITLLHAAISAGKPWAAQRKLTYLMNAHRLDFVASGVILMARSKPVLVSLANLFGSNKVRKRYIALARGEPAKDQFEVDAKLAPHPARPELMRVDPRRGKNSRTSFSVMERFRGWTLLAAEPLTSRTHQIRAHLRHAKLPLAGDELYGGSQLRLSSLKKNYVLKPGQSERPLIWQPALHAERLELDHPVTQTPLVIQAPWPKDLKVAVKYLRMFAQSS